jgi:hypothetical protein
MEDDRNRSIDVEDSRVRSVSTFGLESHPSRRVGEDLGKQTDGLS